MKLLSLSLISFTAFSALVTAIPMPGLDQLTIFKSSEEELRLVKYSDDSPAKWMTESDKMALLRAGVKFMDITDYPEDMMDIQTTWKPYIPTKVLYEDEAMPFINNLTTTEMTRVLTRLTQFRTRYYKSATGLEASNWLYDQILGVVVDEEASDYIEVRKFEHNGWKQNSIIARIEGSDEEFKDEVVIVSAHLDSVNMWTPYLPAPGADDNGSGTVTIFETFRTLVANGFRPERSVEFHWYSAEEAGLLGSQDVARSYKENGIRVVAMMQNDMTGYIGEKGEVIGVVTDHVDKQLTEFLKKLVDSYASIPYVETECGYACSDHASWRKAGYPSAFAIESAFKDSNQAIHTTRDTISRLSFDHMLEFSKVAVGFAVELSHVRDEDMDDLM